MFKNMRTLYISGFVLMTLFGIYYYQDILFTKPQIEEVPVSVVETVDRQFSVKGMFCESCKNKIESAVSQLPGVASVSVTPTKNEMTVSYNKGNENIQQTLAVVKDLGYTPGLKSNSGKLQVLDFNVTFK